MEGSPAVEPSRPTQALVGGHASGVDTAKSWGEWVRNYKSEKLVAPPISKPATRHQDLSERYPRRDPVLCKYTDNAVETRVAAEESQATASRVRRKLERDTKAGQIRDFNILSNSQQDAASSLDVNTRWSKQGIKLLHPPQRVSRLPLQLPPSPPADHDVCNSSGKSSKRKNKCNGQTRQPFFDMFPSAIAEDLRAASITSAMANNGSKVNGDTTRSRLLSSTSSTPSSYRQRLRSFDIVSNQLTQQPSGTTIQRVLSPREREEINALAIEERDRSLRERARAHFRETQALNPVQGRFVDEELEKEFVHAREAAAKSHGADKHYGLPPTIRYSEGMAFDIVSGAAKDAVLARVHTAKMRNQRYDEVISALSRPNTLVNTAKNSSEVGNNKSPEAREAFPSLSSYEHGAKVSGSESHTSNTTTTPVPNSTPRTIEDGIGTGTSASLCHPAPLPPVPTFPARGTLRYNIELAQRERGELQAEFDLTRGAERRSARALHVTRADYDILTNRPFVYTHQSETTFPSPSTTSSVSHHQEHNATDRRTGSLALALAAAGNKIAQWEKSRVKLGQS